MIVFPHSWETAGFSGVLIPGMIICVETFVGRRGWGQGVKLEQQVLVTEASPEVLTNDESGLR